MLFKPRCKAATWQGSLPSMQHKERSPLFISVNFSPASSKASQTVFGSPFSKSSQHVTEKMWPWNILASFEMHTHIICCVPYISPGLGDGQAEISRGRWLGKNQPAPCFEGKAFSSGNSDSSKETKWAATLSAGLLKSVSLFHQINLRSLYTFYFPNEKVQKSSTLHCRALESNLDSFFPAFCLQFLIGKELPNILIMGIYSRKCDFFFLLNATQLASSGFSWWVLFWGLLLVWCRSEYFLPALQRLWTQEWHLIHF